MMLSKSVVLVSACRSLARSGHGRLQQLVFALRIQLPVPKGTPAPSTVRFTQTPPVGEADTEPVYPRVCRRTRGSIPRRRAGAYCTANFRDSPQKGPSCVHPYKAQTGSPSGRGFPIGAIPKGPLDPASHPKGNSLSSSGPA